MIAFDASTGANAHQAVMTFSHTIADNGNMILFYIEIGHISMPVTGVTWNGDAMTSLINYDGSNGGYTRIWYLINPDVGTHNIVATSANADHWHVGIAASYSGALQSGVPDASDTLAANGSTTSVEKALTTVADNCWIIFAINTGSGLALTMGDNTYQRDSESGFSALEFLDTNAAQTPAGEKTMAFTCSSQYTAGVIASFAPTAEPKVYAKEFRLNVAYELEPSVVT